MKKLLFILILFISCFVNVTSGQEVYVLKLETDFFGEETTKLIPTRVIVNDSTIIVYEKGKTPETYLRDNSEPKSFGDNDKCVELATGCYGYETIYLCYKDKNKFLKKEECYQISFRVITTQYACTPQSKGCIIWHWENDNIQEIISYWKELWCL